MEKLLLVAPLTATPFEVQEYVNGPVPEATAGPKVTLVLGQLVRAAKAATVVFVFTTSTAMQLLVLLLESTTVTTMFVVPELTTVPLVGNWVTEKVLQVSLIVSPVVKSGTEATPARLVGQIVWFGAQTVITGGVVSRTVTVKEQAFVLRKTSLAVQVTVVTPKPKRAPEATATPLVAHENV